MEDLLQMLVFGGQDEARLTGSPKYHRKCLDSGLASACSCPGVHFLRISSREASSSLFGNPALFLATQRQLLEHVLLNFDSSRTDVRLANSTAKAVYASGMNALPIMARHGDRLVFNSIKDVRIESCQW